MHDNNEFDREASETREVTGVVAEKGFDLKKEIFEWVSSIVIAIIVALILKNYVVTLVRVDGTSMVPTLQNAERLVVVRLGYKPQSGDIVIFHPPNGREPYVKRIIGMPGQEIFIDNSTGKVYVDGDELDEPYINNKTTSGASQFTVPENHVFVMGDNRMNSHDSRRADVGYISFDAIMGKAVFRVWPLSQIGTLK